MRMLAAIFSLAIGGTAWAQSTQVTLPTNSEVLAEFAHPHTSVEIGRGRKLNLFCMGSGQHTVLFDAGGSDWSVIWGLVQPAVAQRARACSYDRAGLGYSSPATGARSPMAIIEDLHTLIHSSSLKTPLVLVGHSLGGFNVKLYAELYPEDVAGIVLIDPAEERSAERVRDRLRARFGQSVAARTELADNDWLKRLIGHYDACAADTRSRPLTPGSDRYKACTDPVRPALGHDIAAERERLQVTSSYQEAQASEVRNSVYADTRNDPVYRDLFCKGSLGSRPLIVLTHGIFDPSDPLDAASFESYLWLHRETASLSKRGRQRTIPNTSHNIEIDAPEAVRDAVFEILREIER